MHSNKFTPVFFHLLFLAATILPLAGFSQEKTLSPKKDYLVTISTSLGDMQVVLFDATPEHKKNFVKLAAEGFYDSTTFHRIISTFMIQGGDPLSKKAATLSQAGTGGPGYTLPAEIQDDLYHFKGMLAAARLGDQANPEKRSSGSQFYLVQGKKYTDKELDAIESRVGAGIGKTFTFPDSVRETYKTLGGSPWLDKQYSVFGQVVGGLDVIDKIAAVKTLPGDRPEKPLMMTMKVEVLSKKKITKTYGYTYPAQ